MSTLDKNRNSQAPSVAIVTGGASGIGRAVAESLARDNIAVVISDINRDAGQTVAGAVNGHYVQADLTKGEDCIDLVRASVERYGSVDMLVNNAGIQHVSPIESFAEDKWMAMIHLMLIAPFVLTKQVWPYMKKKGYGRIVNIGSIHSHVASLNKSAYVSAKHGLMGLTKAAALEGGGCGITVNAVCPAYVRTPLVENQISTQAKSLNISEAQVEENVLLKSALVKRLIEPEEVAELVCYLCSDKAGAVTGASWNIDCGWTAQ